MIKNALNDFSLFLSSLENKTKVHNMHPFLIHMLFVVGQKIMQIADNMRSKQRETLCRIKLHAHAT